MSIVDFDALHVDPEVTPQPPPAPKLPPEILQATRKHKRTEIKKLERASKKPKDDTPAEIPEEKKQLLGSLRTYRDNAILGPALKNRVEFKNLEKLSVADLKDRLEQVELALSQANNSSLIDGMVSGTLYWAENVLSTEKYNFRGTSDQLYKNDHWVFLLERVKIKYGLQMSTTLDPGVELFLVTVQTMMAVQRMNRLQNLHPLTDLDRKIQVE